MHREAPAAGELLLDASRSRELRVESIDGPSRVVYDVSPVVDEAAREDPCRVRFERGHGEPGWKGQKGAHPQGRMRASIARGCAQVRDRRGPAEASRGRVEVQVRLRVQADLHRVSDQAAGHEFPESDRAADRGELGPAMATGHAGAVDLFILLEPPHRHGPVRRAMRVRLSLDQRLPIRIEDGYG